MDATHTTSRAHFSIPSIIAIVAAIASLFTGAGWGLLLAVIAIITGIIGVMLSMSPTIRGGVISVLALCGGALGIIVALIRAVSGMGHRHY